MLSLQPAFGGSALSRDRRSPAPARSVERGAEAIVRGGLALERADLREQRHHVEVVGEALDLPILDLEDLARGQLDALVRRRDNARRRLERACVDALPHDLENGGVTARVLGDERGLRVRDGLAPALPGLDDLPDALDAPPRPLLVVHALLGEHGFHLVPVLVVVRDRGGLGLRDVLGRPHKETPSAGRCQPPTTAPSFRALYSAEAPGPTPPKRRQTPHHPTPTTHLSRRIDRLPSIDPSARGSVQ